MHKIKIYKKNELLFELTSPINPEVDEWLWNGSDSYKIIGKYYEIVNRAYLVINLFVE